MDIALSCIAACILGNAYGYWFRRAFGKRFGLPVWATVVMAVLSWLILWQMVERAS